MSEIQEYQGSMSAVDFAKAFPEYEQKLKGKTGLDPNSQQKLNDMHRQMRLNPPKPATVINLHPFPLKVNGGKLFAGITIPACEPGSPFAHYHIRGYKWDWREEEDGSITPIPIFPIELARDFVREFNTHEGIGPGVIVYEGEAHPNKAKDVELYDDRGEPKMEAKPVEYVTPEGEKQREVMNVPVKQNLADVIEEMRKRRNARYRVVVQQADADFNRADGEGRKNVTDVHRLMAEVLFSERIIPSKPNWILQTRSDMGITKEDCPSCTEPRKKGATFCKACNYIYEPLKAYELSRIEYGHLAMERMSAEEWAKANAIREQREAAKSGKPKTDKKA